MISDSLLLIFSRSNADMTIGFLGSPCTFQMRLTVKNIKQNYHFFVLNQKQQNGNGRPFSELANKGLCCLIVLMLVDVVKLSS